MNVDVNELIAEIGRLHIQIMAQQKRIADLEAAVKYAYEAGPTQTEE